MRSSAVMLRTSGAAGPRVACTWCWLPTNPRNLRLPTSVLIAMDKKSFWSGFACGAGAVIGGGLVAGRLRRGGASRILRLEKSIQIARPGHDVWGAWGGL